MTDSGVVLTQDAIWEKTNEIPVFLEMLTQPPSSNRRYVGIGGPLSEQKQESA